MPKEPKSVDGLSGDDKRQADLRDERRGTYGTGGQGSVPDKQSSKQTEHQRSQQGADVREPAGGAAPAPAKDFDLPEGLKRQRQGPYDKDRGRDQQPSQVPSNWMSDRG
jgi:hypothetical protein